MVDFNKNFQPPALQPSRMQTQALRGAVNIPAQDPRVQTPTRTPQSQAEVDALRGMREAEAAQAGAARARQGGWSGSGLIGAGIAKFMQGRRQNNLEPEYTAQELQRLEQAAALEEMIANRDFQDTNNVSMFESALSRQNQEGMAQIRNQQEIAAAALERENEVADIANQQNFDLYNAEQLRLQELADRRNQEQNDAYDAEQARIQELADERRLWEREDDQLKTALENDAALLDAERAEVQRIANDTRTWATIAETDESMDIYLSRYNELLSALPQLAQMAGVEEDMANLSQVDESAKAWGWFKRWTGGSGPLASMMPALTFREPTQLIEEISASEALNKLGTLDVPLTPVSDADMAVVMATGLSPWRTEKYNYNTAKDAIRYLEIEMNDILSKQQSLNLGGRPSSGIIELTDEEVQAFLNNGAANTSSE